MSPEARNAGWGLWWAWVIATLIGWVGGVVVGIVLSYQVVNLFYPKETNLIIGLCVGAAVGLAQKIAVRRSVTLAGSWVWGAAVGLGIPFVVAVVIDELWLFGAAEASEGWLIVSAVVGGAIAGLLQVRALRPHTPKAQWWVLASLVSWGLAWLTGIVIGGCWFPVGGIVLGAVSGGLLMWLLRSSPAAEAV
ncbi:MAG: hypothetical protein KAS80_07615 [Anaerolineales bacterium]|nr:hypothetical protein [Anaerolineales bacterium]